MGTVAPNPYYTEEVAERCRKYADLDVTRESIPVYPSVHFFMGGIAVDNQHETNVENLFAVGECASIYHGANRLGGNAGLETMVFGRIAGKTAAEMVQDVALPQETEAVADMSADVDIRAMNDSLRQILRKYLNVVRDAENLPKAEKALEELDASLSEYRYSFDKFRLHNDILTAKLLLKAAMARKTSVGCHVWETEGEKEAPYRVVLQSVDDKIAVSQEAL
jgi:aspartate oxidase